MTPFIFRLAATTELGLMVAEATERFPETLPLAGSHGLQLAILIAGALCLHEIKELITEAVTTVRAWWRGGT